MSDETTASRNISERNFAIVIALVAAKFREMAIAREGTQASVFCSLFLTIMNATAKSP